ncbi:hypothetical protein, partial [Klebsiella aerogenes]|uniref:hypothetical protein n=1 Tax=Klebsiella aerogenes TaxID=548 RepID=UPI001A9C5CE2
ELRKADDNRTLPEGGTLSTGRFNGLINERLTALCSIIAQTTSMTARETITIPLSPAQPARNAV